MHHASSAFFLGDPSGGFQNRTLAELDPSLVLEGQSPRLLDEWQEVPALWDAVRHEVDKSGVKGRFILTGSATPNRKGILHSGAGRIARLRMRPMSLYESGESTGVISLLDLCRGVLKPAMTGDVQLRKIADMVVRGGWPGSIGLSADNAASIPLEYLESIIQDDVFRIDGVKRDTQKMKRLLRSLARNESTTATNKTLRQDVQSIDDDDIDGNTIASYLDVFSRLFLTDNQLPFSSRLRSSVRVKQSEKRHLADPSLACALLGINPSRLIGDLKTFGFLFEALCERDLKIYADSFGGSLFHYQDYANRELDAVIELPDGSWSAFEIKLGANEIEAAASNLIKIRDAMLADPVQSTPPVSLCVVCGLSNSAYRREDGVFVVPLTALRP